MKPSRLLPALFSGGFLLALLPFLGRSHLLGLDESIYANVVRETLGKGRFFPWVFEGSPFFEKPPLGLGWQVLSARIFGIGEWAVRLPSALAGAGCVYLTWRLGERIGRGAIGGFVAAAALALSEHFVLFSRVANLDMMLTLCLLGSWWELLKAYNFDTADSRTTRGREAAKKGIVGNPNPPRFHLPAFAAQEACLLRAGLWVAAGLLVKSFFALLFVLPALAAFRWSRTNAVTPRLLLLGLGTPVLSALAAWFAIYGVVFGRPFFEWELGSNVLYRLSTGAVGRLFRPGDTDFQSWQLYAEILKNGMAFVWPLVPMGLAVWAVEAKRGRSERQADPALLGGLFIFLAWTFLIVVLMRPLINYLMPLVPLLALALAALTRIPPTRMNALLLGAGSLLAVLNGLNRHAHSLAVFVLACVLGLLSVRTPQDRPAPRARPLRAAALLLLLAGAGWKMASYLPHPPDPNGRWVAAVQAHPPRKKGEPLLFYGDPVEARVLRFYTDYDVRWTTETPLPRPKEALLFEYEGKVHFLPAMNSQ